MLKLGSTIKDKQRVFAMPWADYELLDAGDGKKLERWGEVVTIRPDVQATMTSGLLFAEWLASADWVFEEHSTTQGQWLNLKVGAPETWRIAYDQLSFSLKLTQFKHVGLFPEQQANWQFINEQVTADHKVLNLFAYTGAASLMARATGATVVHVDAVKQMLTWANNNQALSGLSDIKWVLEDALKFAQRELKRGNFYDGIIMDPPAWGLGANGEKWKLEDQLSRLIETAHGLMNPKAFLILNTYSPRVTLEALNTAAAAYFPGPNRQVKQLWMPATSGNELYCGNLLRAIK